MGFILLVIIVSIDPRQPVSAMALIKILSLALLSSSLVAAAPRSAQLTRARRAAAPDPLLNNLVGGLARPFLNLFHLGGSKKPAARPRPAPRPAPAHVYHPAPVHVAAPDPAPAPALPQIHVLPAPDLSHAAPSYPAPAPVPVYVPEAPAPPPVYTPTGGPRYKHVTCQDWEISEIALHFKHSLHRLYPRPNF